MPMTHPRIMIAGLMGMAAMTLAGCGDEPAAKQTAAPGPAKTEQQRQIDNTEAASAVGYDGQAVKQAVQRTVDVYDRNNAKINEAAQSAGQTDPDQSK